MNKVGLIMIKKEKVITIVILIDNFINWPLCWYSYILSVFGSNYSKTPLKILIQKGLNFIFSAH